MKDYTLIIVPNTDKVELLPNGDQMVTIVDRIKSKINSDLYEVMFLNVPCTITAVPNVSMKIDGAELKGVLTNESRSARLS